MIAFRPSASAESHVQSTTVYHADSGWRGFKADLVRVYRWILYEGKMATWLLLSRLELTIDCSGQVSQSYTRTSGIGHKLLLECKTWSSNLGLPADSDSLPDRR